MSPKELPQSLLERAGNSRDSKWPHRLANLPVAAQQFGCESCALLDRLPRDVLQRDNCRRFLHLEMPARCTGILVAIAIYHRREFEFLIPEAGQLAIAAVSTQYGLLIMSSKQLHFHRHRVLGAEWLEHRQPLAGDVAVALFGNQLVIEGDAAANAIEISAAQGGGFNISGSGEGAAATTINGSSNAFHVAAANSSNILINLGEGDDRVTIGSGAQSGGGTSPGVSSLLANGHNLRLPGDVTILGGAGNDQIAVTGVRLGSLTVMADPLNGAASGTDSVRLTDIRTSGDVTVATMGGNDAVALAGAVRIGGDLKIDSGDGTDALSMAASRFQVRGDVNIDPATSAVAGSTVTNQDAAATSADGGVATPGAAVAVQDPMNAGAATSMPDALQSFAEGATALTNQIAMIDPVGAGNPGLLSTATTAGLPLTSDQTLANDQLVGPNGVLANSPLTGRLNPDSTGVMNDGTLVNSLANAGLVPNMSNGSMLNNSLAAPSAITDPNAVAAQSALLQNAAALAASQTSPFINPAAADNLFSRFNESNLIGSAARNPTFLSNISQPDPFSNVMNPLSGLSSPFAF